MKNWFAGLMVVCIAILLWATIRVKELKRDLDVATANLKAYDNQLGTLKAKNTAYQLTVDQLEYFQDSVLKELDKTRKELKVKDSQLKSLQYVSSAFTKSDTIVLNDTIFRIPSFALDTLLKDEWYQVQIGLQYPATIAVSPTFVSKKHIIVSLKKETVNPPKKFFLFRWFQRKHKVLHVDVVEKNPYVKDENSKYVEIIK